MNHFKCLALSSLLFASGSAMAAPAHVLSGGTCTTFADPFTAAAAAINGDTIFLDETLGTVAFTTFPTELVLLSSVTVVPQDMSAANCTEGSTLDIGPIPGVTTRLVRVGNGSAAPSVEFRHINLIDGDASFMGGAFGGQGGNLLVRGGSKAVMQGGGLFSGIANRGGNASVAEASSLTLYNARVFNGLAVVAGGGGIMVRDGSTLESDQTTFDRNTATLSGGAIGMVGDFNTAIVRRSTFEWNLATDGGAIAPRLSSDTLLSEGSVFEYNHATRMGGAIYARGRVDLRSDAIAGGPTELSYNSANFGGGLAFDFVTLGGLGSTSSIMNTVFDGNQANGDGGGIALLVNDSTATSGFSLSIEDALFAGNEAFGTIASAAGDGGAIAVSALNGGASAIPWATLTIDATTFSHNKAARNGGGVTLFAMPTAGSGISTLITSVSDVSFNDNEAEVRGGAIATFGNTSAFIASTPGTNCQGGGCTRFYSNRATGASTALGGAIFHAGQTLAVAKADVTGNGAFDGAAIIADSSVSGLPATVVISDSLFDWNVSTPSRSIVELQGASSTLLFRGNTVMNNSGDPLVIGGGGATASVEANIIRSNALTPATPPGSVVLDCNNSDAATTSVWNTGTNDVLPLTLAFPNYAIPAVSSARNVCGNWTGFSFDGVDRAAPNPGTNQGAMEL